MTDQVNLVVGMGERGINIATRGLNTRFIYQLS